MTTLYLVHDTAKTQQLNTHQSRAKSKCNNNYRLGTTKKNKHENKKEANS